MSVQVNEPSARRGTGAETCPHCGQRLLTQGAARHLHTSELEFERKLEEAVRALFAEFAVEPAAETEPETSASSPHFESVRELPALRLLFRQF